MSYKLPIQSQTMFSSKITCHQSKLYRPIQSFINRSPSTARAHTHPLTLICTYLPPAGLSSHHHQHHHSQSRPPTASSISIPKIYPQTTSRPVCA